MSVTYLVFTPVQCTFTFTVFMNMLQCCSFEFLSNLLIKFYFYKCLWILLLGCHRYKVKSEPSDVLSGKEYKVILLYIGNCQERLGMLYEYEHLLFDWSQSETIMYWHPLFDTVNTAQAFMSEDQSPNKKPRLIDSMKIGTHNGSFHCDEILACFMLRQLPKYADAEVIRYTRLYCNVRDKYCLCWGLNLGPVASKSNTLPIWI